MREEWLEGVETVGITSGASAPEELVKRPCRAGSASAAPRTSRSFARVHEDVRFMLPKEIGDELAARA